MHTTQPLLQPDAFLERCSELGIDNLASLWLEASLPSTQDWLWSHHPPPPGRMNVALALSQSQGRGQHGRPWHAPAGGLYLSCAFHHDDTLAHPLPPSLRLGCFLHWMLVQRWPNLQPVLRLKWPNDLWLPRGKCGGVLVESDPTSQQHVVGIGLNLCRPDPPADTRPGPMAGLSDHASCDTTEDLLNLAVDVLRHARWCLTHRRTPWPIDPLTYWPTVDAYAGHQVLFTTPQGQAYPGQAVGMNANGHYVVACNDGQTRTFVSGRLHREVPA